MQQADSEGYTHSSDLEAESSITSLSSAITKAGDLIHFARRAQFNAEQTF